MGRGSWPDGLPKKDGANALSGAGLLDTATTCLSKTSRTKNSIIEKKKATFHVTPAPASPRTVLPQPPRIPVTGALGRPPARLPHPTTPAASAEQPAAPDGGRACGLGVGAGQPALLKGGTAEETNAEERGGDC